MSLEILRRLGFEGPISGFVRQPPPKLREPNPVTGVHLQFDSTFLWRITTEIERGFRLERDDGQTISVASGVPPRVLRRLAIEFSLQTFDANDAFKQHLGWPARCREMGYPENSKPVIIVVDYGPEAELNWLAELPRSYEGFPIRYRFSPPAQTHLGPGSVAYGIGIGTLGGILEDSVTHAYYGMTCAHVAGAKGGRVIEFDKKSKPIGSVGNVIDSVLPALATGACNAHAQPGAGLDVALIGLDSPQSITTASGLTVGQIEYVDQDDPIAFVGGKSAQVSARVAAATIWKKVDVAGTLHCFGDLFAIGHRQPAYILQAVSEGGDSGAWIFGDSPNDMTSTLWLGMLIAGDKQQNQSLACYSEHLFDWAKQLRPDIVLCP
jgi:hypothetical protein